MNETLEKLKISNTIIKNTSDIGYRKSYVKISLET